MAGSSSPLVAGIGTGTADEMEGKRGGQTVSSRFTGQLRELVSMLDATGLHFVRCIKPNAALAPNKLATDLVLQQLRCCGVLEVARVSRAGFPTRYRSGRHQGITAHVLAEQRVCRLVDVVPAFVCDT